MAEKKAKTEEVVEKKKPTSTYDFVASQLAVLNMADNQAKAQRNIERVLKHARRKEKK